MTHTECIEHTGLWDMGTHAALHWDADVWLYKLLCKAPCPPCPFFFELIQGRLHGVVFHLDNCSHQPMGMKGDERNERERALQKQQRAITARLNGQEVEGRVCICRKARAGKLDVFLKEN